MSGPGQSCPCNSGSWCNSNDNKCYETCVSRGICTNANAIPRKNTYFCDYSNCPSCTECSQKGLYFCEVGAVNVVPDVWYNRQPLLASTTRYPEYDPVDPPINVNGLKLYFRQGASSCPAPPPPVPVDCKVSEWGVFSECDATACGTSGQKRRTRTIIQQPANGGQVCPSLSETTACSAAACIYPVPAPAQEPAPSPTTTPAVTAVTPTTTPSVLSPSTTPPVVVVPPADPVVIQSRPTDAPDPTIPSSTTSAVSVELPVVPPPVIVPSPALLAPPKKKVIQKSYLDQIRDWITSLFNREEKFENYERTIPTKFYLLLILLLILILFYKKDIINFSKKVFK